VGDVTKWYVGNSVAFLGRIEISHFDGRRIDDYYNHYTSPVSILAIGSGLGFHGLSRVNPYLDIDVPSITLNFDGQRGGELRTGFGIGLGIEVGIDKSTFGVEEKFNSYAVRGYSPLQFWSVGVKAAF
jgi:hypothetical protein